MIPYNKLSSADRKKLHSNGFTILDGFKHKEFEYITGTRPNLVYATYGIGNKYDILVMIGYMYLFNNSKARCKQIALEICNKRLTVKQCMAQLDYWIGI
jgi:hypothetical protein